MWWNILVCALLLGTGLLLYWRLTRREASPPPPPEDFTEEEDLAEEGGIHHIIIGRPMPEEVVFALRFDRFQPFTMRPTTRPPPPPPRRPPPPPVNAQAVAANTMVRSDRQNVHDSVLIGHLKAALEAFPRPPKNNNGLRELRAYLAGNEAAIKTLDTMESNATALSSLKMTEADVVARVWGVIEARDDKEERRRVLAERLAESNEEGSCATGRVARVVDSLSAVDDRVQLKPTWALRRELLDKAAVLSQTHDEATQGPLVERLRKEFRKEYVDTGLVPAARLKAELDEWGAHI